MIGLVMIGLVMIGLVLVGLVMVGLVMAWPCTWSAGLVTELNSWYSLPVWYREVAFSVVARIPGPRHGPDPPHA